MKKAVFHLDELHIGPKAERGRKGRKLRDVVLRKPEAEKDEPEFFVSFWVYSDMGKLDRDASRLDIRFGLDELRRNSIKTVLNRTVFAVPGELSYFKVYACFRRLEEGKEEPIQEIQSVRDFAFLPEIDEDDLRRLPASYYAGIPADIFPEGSMKSLAAMGEALPFGDLMCGYVLRSIGDLPTFPIALRFNIGKTKWFRGLTPTRVPAAARDTLDAFFSGKWAMLLNESTPEPVFNTQNGDETKFPKIGFAPKDSLNDIYNMVFRPDEVSGAEGANWFSRGWKTDFVEPAKFRGSGMDKKSGPDKWVEIVNRVAIAAVVYHMRQAQKQGLDNFRQQWIFTTYAPYVIRAKYSARPADLPPHPRPFEAFYTSLMIELELYLKAIFEWENSSRTDPMINPMTGEPLTFRTLDLLRDVTPEMRLFTDILVNPQEHTEHLRQEAVYVLWRPVHITGESMGEYIREKRGSMPSVDTSITIAEMLSDFYTIRHLDVNTEHSAGEYIDTPRHTILWSGEGLGFASFRSTDSPKKMSTQYGSMEFSHIDSLKPRGWSFPPLDDDPRSMRHRSHTLLPRLLLDIDFTRGNETRTKTQLFSQRMGMTPEDRAAERNPHLDKYPKLGHREEMSFREYVRLQGEFARVTADLMPDNLLFADQKDRVMDTSFNNKEARDQFYTAWKEGTARDLTLVTTPLPALL